MEAIYNGKIGPANDRPMTEKSWIVKDKYRVFTWRTGKMSWEAGKFTKTQYSQMVEEIYVNIHECKSNNIFALFMGLTNLILYVDVEFVERIKAGDNVEVRYPSDTNC